VRGSNRAGEIMFGTVLLTILALLHLYVFWRAATVPHIARRVPPKVICLSGAVLCALFALARSAGHGSSGPVAGVVEFVGMTWMATLFLLFAALLAADAGTAFGILLPKLAPSIRGWALVAGGALAVIALVQGLRPPAVVHYEVRLAGLPSKLDGTVIVAVSDLHLGNQLGERWLEARAAQIRSQRPSLVVFLGDVVEGHGRPADNLLPIFRRIRAPLGVWAVTGNHEYHHGTGDGLKVLEDAGFQVLHDMWTQVCPGLILAGVDDLTSRRRSGEGARPLAEALAGRPAGATVLLSHTPWYSQEAATLGVGLMLCGHTHGGQIWPFGELTRLEYPLLGGRYEVGGATVLVCRGTGTWGPRMRLWRRGEILRVTLRSR
jgi:uncharacterized protein